MKQNYTEEETITEDLPIEQSLEEAKGLVKNIALVIGYDEDGDLYFSSSTSNGGSVVAALALANRFVEENIKEGP